MQGGVNQCVGLGLECRHDMPPELLPTGKAGGGC